MTLNSGSVNGWGNLISVPMSTDPSWHSVDTRIYETLTLVLLNKLRCRTHFYFSANQITWSRLLIQIHILNGKQSRSRSVGFFMAFVDLEKAFDWVHRKVIWWALRKRCGGVDCGTGAGDVCKCVEPCPCWWGVQWRVWSEGWCSRVLSPLLFIILLEALSREFHSGVP